MDFFFLITFLFIYQQQQDEKARIMKLCLGNQNLASGDFRPIVKYSNAWWRSQGPSVDYWPNNNGFTGAPLSLLGFRKVLGSAPQKAN